MNKWTRSNYRHATTGHRSLIIEVNGTAVAKGDWLKGTHRREADAVVDTLVRNANAFDGLLESLVDALSVLRWIADIDGPTRGSAPAPEWVKAIYETAAKHIQAIPANGDHFHFWSLPGENGRTCLYCDTVWH